MPHIEPDHRARKILEEAGSVDECSSTDPLDRELFYFVKTGAAVDTSVPAACELWGDVEYRHIVNALALCGANDEQVASGLGIPERVYEIYKTLFFDASTFPHNLAKTRYVRQLNCPEELRTLYELAVERGPSELIERYRIGGRARLEPEDVIYGGMADMWSKFLSHRGFTVTSDTAKEALRWGEAALRTAKLVMEHGREERKGASTVDDLRIALEIRNETRTLQDLNVGPDDLVTE